MPGDVIMRRALCAVFGRCSTRHRTACLNKVCAVHYVPCSVGALLTIAPLASTTRPLPPRFLPITTLLLSFSVRARALSHTGIHAVTHCLLRGRYVGSDVRWRKKATAPKPAKLAQIWAMPRAVSYWDYGSALLTRAGRAVGMVGDESYYEVSSYLVHSDMEDGDPFDKHDSSRVAFPVVWAAAAHGKSLSRL